MINTIRDTLIGNKFPKFLFFSAQQKQPLCKNINNIQHYCDVDVIPFDSTSHTRGWEWEDKKLKVGVVENLRLGC